MKKIKVYLAGKIAANDWRQKIVDIRDNFFGNEKYKIRHGMELVYNDYITITGPFFLSCDHRCYHGNNSHGVGLNRLCPDGERYDCYAETDYFSEGEVKNICLNQIKKSDVIFAYINSDECFGTLYELGYAAALGKPILLLFDNEDRRKNMWFISTGAKLSGVQQPYTGIKENFEEFIQLYYKKS